ncbi:DUF1620-domain-containing protein [Punctularia strigosozonata HHB-11173 SS5]|uniref:DUF1620-domain-containing protein n=1 Tax=Punctularia strigosozonata (strain HHB-11173) TaxID=741275 RepID=UPI00044173F4|nr:DUF1620-domain-containing protein [Punctularia strigosozonata HHB-11173 SS5]EIN05678.1 DUF1620-domain-containing protein [Punctularia strigosozonata HHB-11173 SS5]
MRSVYRCAALLALHLAPWTAHALHASEAGVLDWYTPLMGQPITETLATAPTFHRVTQEGGASESVVLAATAANVLAGVNPVNGSLAWRHVFEDEDAVIAFQKHKNVVASVSGPSGSTLRLFDALKGHLLLEQRIHAPEVGRLHQPESVGVAIAFYAENEESDILVLTSGDNLRRLNGKTGELKWSWTAQDQGSLVIYSKIIPSPNAIYLVGLAKSFAGYTLHVSALSPADGSLLASQPINSQVENGLTDFLYLASPSSSANRNPRLVWLEHATIRSVDLTPLLDAKGASTKGTAYKRIIDVGLAEHGQFVAIKEDGTGRVFRLDVNGAGEGSIKGIWEFQRSATSKDYSDSMYSGGVDKDGHPYIGRVFWSHALQQAGYNIFAAHLGDGKGLVSGFAFPFDTDKHGIISHVAIDAANPQTDTVVSRIVLTTTTGAVQLWTQDKVSWTREESLASISVAEFVDLPEPSGDGKGAARDHEGWLARTTRHFADAQNLPEYLAHFAKRFATGSYASVSAPVSPVNPSNATSLARDAFGLKKIIVAATPFGNVFGIDSSTGKIVWSRVLGLGWAAEVGGRVLPVKLFVMAGADDGSKPEVLLITQRRAENTLVDTVVFHLDALTGADASGAAPTPLIQGIDVIPGALVESYFIPEIKTALLFDEFLQLHTYPDNPKVKSALKKLAPSLHFSLRAGKPGSRQLIGHRIMSSDRLPGIQTYVGYPTWTLALPPSEEIITIVPRPREPVASLGKVLGNRTTLYKYLNPNVVAVLTSNPETPSCGVYVVDQAKGTTLYRAKLPAFGGRCDVHATFAENWLVYHYYDGDNAGASRTKAYRVVSVELYEGKGVDDKTRSSELSSLSPKSTALSALEQVYLFPHGVMTMTTTSTKYGMTAKDLIVANKNGQIQSFPRRLLDPRRPKRKPTVEEQEEWLIQYDPLLPDDPRRVLSHNYDVEKVRRIITSPALLESTSLVFAYGLDLFSTRTAPSKTFDVLNENFNKVQLVLTITGLAVAIFVTKPMVQRKRLREKWYQ